MNPLLRSWARVAPGFVAVLLALGVARSAAAQCPLAAACTPGTASSPQAAAFGMAILQVTVGNNLINRTSAGYTSGYHDYSCTLNAALVVGQSYPISVRTTTNAAQNVRVWIDYNNDGAFTGSNELVFNSNNAIAHSGTFTTPATATLGARLRLRVAADYALGTIPTSCSTPVYSQDEDYSVTLAANVNAPVAAFTTNGTTTCSGCVQFTDASQNLPTSWLWTFGDGATSTLQNPNHCYPAPGTFTVQLQATNAAGTTTSAATTIVYNNLAPVAASCSPQTTSYYANYGITRFRLGSIDNASADGSAGYQDFSCPQRTDLTLNVNYPLLITTGGVNPHDIRVYLDKNNDGVLTTSELIYQSLNTPTPGATSTLNLAAAGIILNQPLRLRVVADAIGSAAGPCTAPTSGQAEDYTVVVRANTAPPVAAFSTNYVAGTCVNPILFTDFSTNGPTAWAWTFGDGGTSTLQNPSHQYLASGTYTVTLTATNTNGANTVTRANAVTVSVPCLAYCASNGSGGTSQGGQQFPSQLFITNVGVANAAPVYANTTGVATGGYANYTTQPISIAPSRLVNLTVTTNLAAVHRTAVWVDVNQNGTFDAAELLANGVTAAGSAAAVFNASFALPTGTNGLSVRMRIQATASTNAPMPCGINMLNAEVEDYQLIVSPLATREAQALPTLSLYPTPTPDGHLRLRLPDAAAAGLYATEVQSLLGATVLRTSLRLGPTADAELDLSTLAPGVYVLRLQDAQGQTALRRVVRE